MPSVRTAAVVTNGGGGVVASALERLETVAAASGVELLLEGSGRRDPGHRDRPRR